MLGVHTERLAGARLKELGVEIGGVVEKAARAGVTGAGMVGIGVIQRLQIPAAICRELPDCVTTACHQIPQIRGAAHPARIATADPDDGDGLLGGESQPLVLAAQPLVLLQ